MHNLKQQQLQYTVADWTWLRYARVSTVLFFLKTNSSYFATFKERELGKFKHDANIRVASTQFCRCFVRSQKKKLEYTSLWIRSRFAASTNPPLKWSEDGMKTDRRFVLKLLLVLLARTHAPTCTRASSTNERKGQEKWMARVVCLGNWSTARSQAPISVFLNKKKLFCVHFRLPPFFLLFFFSIGRRFVCLSVFFCHFSAFAIQNAVKLWFFLRGHMLSGHLSVLVYV